MCRVFSCVVGRGCLLGPVNSLVKTLLAFALLHSVLQAKFACYSRCFCGGVLERSDRMWCTGEGNGNPLQYSCLENPMNSMKRHKYRTLKDELPRSVGAQYATGDQWRNNSRKNEGMEPKQKQHPVADGTGDRSKVRCCKEEYCIGTWNVRSMNQGKLEVLEQEMTKVNINILGISELRWTGMGEFNSDDHYIYYCGKESLRRNGVAIIVNKRV